MDGGTTSEISGYRQPSRKNAHEIAHRTAGGLCLSALITNPLVCRPQSLPRGRRPTMHLSQWARTPQRLRLLGAGVEVRNKGLPLSLSDPSSSLMLPGRPRLIAAVAPCLSPTSQAVLSRCALERRTGSHRPALSRTRTEVRAALTLDMPPSQRCTKGTQHELLARTPDLDAPKVEGSVAVAVSQDRPERDVRA